MRLHRLTRPAGSAGAWRSVVGQPVLDLEAGRPGELADAGHPQLRTAAVGLPVAGLSGTLDDRFLDNAGRGVVRAKTGSLPNVTSLAGTVVTADDRQLVFALMTDAVPDGGTYGARIILDDFVGSLAECGCTG